jgi:hypothetical protein
VLRSKLAAVLLVGLWGASAANADSIAYYLNQSDRLADGTNYMLVTLEDGVDGEIKFTVQALQPLLDLAGGKFGIDRFAFNVAGGTATEPRNVDAPDGWRARNGTRMDGFGWFDIKLTSVGNKNRQDPLEFSITGVDLDTLASYVELSRGSAKQGFSFFSAHVSGLESGRCGNGNSALRSATSGNGEEHFCTRQAYFGGVTEAPPVPAPPAVWLLGTAVAAVAGRKALRRKAA